MLDLNLDQLPNGTFQVWQPNSAGLIKSDIADTSKRSWRIGGECSTPAKDRQGENVLQKGLDFSEFTMFGWYNDNHQQHTSAAIGVPEVAEFRKGVWYTEGYLLKHVARAQEVYTLAKALEAESHRKLGFSIEGKILERIGNKIVKAIIRNVAITNSPVNTECTWGLISKSFATDMETKSLTVGYARPPVSGGDVLVPEDLEGGEIKYVYKCPTCNKVFSSTGSLEGHISSRHTAKQSEASKGYVIRRAAKSMTAQEAIAHLGKLRPEWSEEIRARFVKYVMESSAE